MSRARNLHDHADFPMMHSTYVVSLLAFIFSLRKSGMHCSYFWSLKTKLFDVRNI